MKVQHDLLLMQVLREHVEHCDDPDHVADQLSLCKDLLSSLTHRGREDARSAQFTVESAMTSARERVPEDSWSTTALLGALQEALSSPPWRQPLKRSTIVATALDLLSRRGVPSDELVRDGLSRAVSRRVVLRLVATWWRARRGGDEVQEVPSAARPWAEMLDAATGHLGPASTLHDAVIHSLAGAMGHRVRQMIETSPLDHVVAWRSDQVQPSVEPGTNAGAIQWFVDRFTHTSPTMWRTTSLQWELAMSQDAGAAAHAAGFSEAVLRERPGCGEQALSTLARRALEPHAARGGVVEQLAFAEILRDLVVAIDDGHHAQAMALARSAHEAHPDDPALVQATAFCHLPTEPDAAWRALQDVVPGCVRENPLVLANLASSHLARADPVAALRLLDAIVDCSCDLEVRGWLWNPWDLLEGVPKPALLETTLGAWAVEAHRAIHILRPDAATQMTK